MKGLDQETGNKFQWNGISMKRNFNEKKCEIAWNIFRFPLLFLPMPSACVDWCQHAAMLAGSREDSHASHLTGGPITACKTCLNKRIGLLELLLSLMCRVVSVLSRDTAGDDFWGQVCSPSSSGDRAVSWVFWADFVQNFSGKPSIIGDFFFGGQGSTVL